MYYEDVFRLHGLPASIVSDRGTQFNSNLSCTLCAVVTIHQNLSTRFHPQRDSLTKRVNVIVEQYLPGCVYYYQDDW